MPATLIVGTMGWAHVRYGSLPQVSWLLNGVKPAVIAVLFGSGYVLLETFVERGRFRGTSYRAANWIHVGATQSRGKLDVHMRFPVPLKDIFLFPLHNHFRRELCAAAP